MLGLAEALTEARGKTVCDLGSAEGLISFEFAKAGAARVRGFEFNPALIETAEAMRRKQPAEIADKVSFRHQDLRPVILDTNPPATDYRADIVLALAIVHKLHDPARGVAFVARMAISLAVYRLPVGSRGLIAGKHSGVGCDVGEIMNRHGFGLEREGKGPRTELVQYWRRRT